MAMNVAVKSILLIGLLFKVIFGQDSEIYRCPTHLSRTIYLKAYNNNCYRFDKTEIYWTTARDTCSGEQGHLITIRNQATQNWVLNTLNDLSWSTKGVWIGAHDLDENDVWTWVTGDTLTWNNWGSGQPNCNWFCVEYCANLRRDDGGRWHDKHCNSFYSTYSYICQYDMNPPTTTTSQPNSTISMSTSTESTSEAETTTTTSTTELTTTAASTSQPPTTTTVTSTTQVTTTPSATSTSSTIASTRPTTNISVTPSTSASTTTPLTTSKSTAHSTSSSVATTTVEGSTTPQSNQSRTDNLSNDELKSEALSGVVVACVLGAIALLLIASVCFYKSRKKKSEDNLAVYFDNIIYTVRTGESRMRGHEQNLNNQVPTVNQNEYADINDCGGCSHPPTTKGKEQNQYSEIADLTNLSVHLPKYDNDDYLKCNIAKSKLGNKDATQYLDAYEIKHGDKDTTQYLDACESKLADKEAVQYLDPFEGNPGLYESATEDVCNSMNEQLESSRNCYDECGYVERGDNSPNHYVDLTENVRDEPADEPSLQSRYEHDIYEECANKNEQPSNINDIWENFDGTLDLAKTATGYNNNTYNINT